MRYPATKCKTAQVLLIEDNPGDVILTMRAFKEAKISNQITAVNSGEQALSMLRHEGEYTETTPPDLILLDLNLPKMNGLDVLSSIKSDDSLKRIPVIILSSSRAEQDIARSYNLHASGYIVKPIDLDKFIEAVGVVEQFWFALNVLPAPANANRSN